MTYKPSLFNFYTEDGQELLLINFKLGIGSFHIITEKDVIPLGVDYLRILGVSQLFMSLEITTAGAFSGYGKTVPPSVISIVFTALRIPLALILVHTTLALNGIWWSITISSILKGVLLFVWFYIFMRGEKLIYNRK